MALDTLLQSQIELCYCNTGVFSQLEISLKHQSVTDFKLTWQNDKGGHVFQRQQVKVAEKKGEHFTISGHQLR